MKCEVLMVGSGLPCKRQPWWLVSVRSRKSDAMLTCGGHLNHACSAMLGAEGRPVPLTITPVAGVDWDEFHAARGET